MRVTFVCGSGGPRYPWNDKDVDKGIGGSEEALIYLSRELVKLGHEVVVYNNCAGQTGRFNGVEYRNYVFFDKAPEADVLVAWRNWHLLKGRTDKHRWLWCHDLPQGVHCPTPAEVEQGALEHITKFSLLGNYHKQVYQDYIGVSDDKVFVCPNGVVPEQFDQQIERNPAQVLYFSHPGRGLHKLREYWPQVKAAVPEATLAAFWWETEHFLEPNEALGILPMRKLGHTGLAAECLRSGVLGYPSVFQPEICPITTIKAQFGGAIPVVVVQGGMVDTVQFGVKTSHEFYTNELISALKMSIAGDLEQERAEMMQWARETYSWASVAAQWSSQWD